MIIMIASVSEVFLENDKKNLKPFLFKENLGDLEACPPPLGKILAILDLYYTMLATFS
jgi:hypothetical protein